MGIVSDAWAGSCSAEMIFEPTPMERVMGYRWGILLGLGLLFLSIHFYRKRRKKSKTGS